MTNTSRIEAITPLVRKLLVSSYSVADGVQTTASENRRSVNFSCIRNMSSP